MHTMRCGCISLSRRWSSEITISAGASAARDLVTLTVDPSSRFQCEASSNAILKSAQLGSHSGFSILLVRVQRRPRIRQQPQTFVFCHGGGGEGSCRSADWRNHACQPSCQVIERKFAKLQLRELHSAGRILPCWYWSGERSMLTQDAVFTLSGNVASVLI